MTAFPRIPFPSSSEWEQWLEDNHAGSEGVWVKMAKKDSGIESVRYPEVLESALCFGWIDGRREALDERLLPPAVHAPARAQQVVADQPRDG